MAADRLPTDRPRPVPAEGYRLVVLGSGRAAMAAAREAARRGVRVALILPTDDGISPSPAPAAPSTPLGETIRRLQVQSGIAEPPEPVEDAAIDVLRGRAIFCKARAVAVGGREIRFDKAVLATGTSMVPPAIDGADRADCLRIETLGELTAVPGRLAVVGGGPEACVWAQALCRLGSRVHLVDREPRILPGEEPEVAAMLAARLKRDGVRLYQGCRELAIEGAGNAHAVVVEHEGRREKLLVDRVLLCGPRVPQTAGWGLEAAGVACGEQGAVVSDRLHTTNRRVFAAGGVCGARFAEPEAAEATARLAVHNALGLIGRRASRLVLPRRIATEPAIVRIGPTRSEAAAAQIDCDTHRVELPAPGPTMSGGGLEGLILVHVLRRRETIVGATVVAEAAEELVAPLLLLAARRWPLRALADVVACRASRFALLARLGRECGGWGAGGAWGDWIERWRGRLAGR